MKAIYLILILVLSGCSMQYHEKKFYKKGGTFTCEPVKETIYDTIIQGGDTLVVPRDSIRYVPQINYVPKYVYRYRYLTAKAEAKEETKQVKATAKKDVKLNRQNKKTERVVKRQEEKTKRFKWWLWLLIGIGVGFFLRNILKLLMK